MQWVVLYLTQTERIDWAGTRPVEKAGLVIHRSCTQPSSLRTARLDRAPLRSGEREGGTCQIVARTWSRRRGGAGLPASPTARKAGLVTHCGSAGWYPIVAELIIGGALRKGLTPLEEILFRTKVGGPRPSLVIPGTGHRLVTGLTPNV